VQCGVGLADARRSTAIELAIGQRSEIGKLANAPVHIDFRRDAAKAADDAIVTGGRRRSCRKKSGASP